MRRRMTVTTKMTTEWQQLMTRRSQTMLLTTARAGSQLSRRCRQAATQVRLRQQCLAAAADLRSAVPCATIARGQMQVRGLQLVGQSPKRHPHWALMRQMDAMRARQKSQPGAGPPVAAFLILRGEMSRH